jgi:acyl-coenzyme A thioesterase PaaI-like protein
VSDVEGHQGHQGAAVEHFIGYLGLETWHEEDRTWGRASIHPEMWAPGSQRPRLGLLFALADVVGGSPPDGPLTPTIDLRFQLLAPAPSEGEILLEARPLKVGRRLWTGEVLLRAGGTSEVFARSDFTFMNQHFSDFAGGLSPVERRRDSVLRRMPVSFDELLRMRFLDDGTTEMDPHDAIRNGAVGTIQGGAQAAMAEIVSERALADRGKYLVHDLHLRYLSAIKVGPAVARPEVLPGDELHPMVRVSITDGGADDRLVTTAVAVCRPDPWT